MIQWLNQPVTLWHALLLGSACCFCASARGSIRAMREHIADLEKYGDELSEATDVLVRVADRLSAVEDRLPPAPADAREGV